MRPFVNLEPGTTHLWYKEGMRLLRLFLLVLLAAAPLAAQQEPFSVEKLLSLQRISDPQVIVFSLERPLLHGDGDGV